MANFLDESVAQALIATLIVGKKNSYVSNNPGEAQGVLGYLRGGIRPVGVSTAMGKHLIALEDARRAGYAPPVPVVTPDDSAEYSAEQYSSGLYNK